MISENTNQFLSVIHQKYLYKLLNAPVPDHGQSRDEKQTEHISYFKYDQQTPRLCTIHPMPCDVNAPKHTKDIVKPKYQII